MKVTRVVGWLKGQAGTGNIFEVSKDGGFILVMIWADGLFHAIDHSEVIEHQNKGLAALFDAQGFYLTVDNGSVVNVENPSGWERFYTEAGQNSDSGDEIRIPVLIQFSGELKINLAGLSKLIQLAN